MLPVLTLLSEQPLVFVFALICLGTALGKIKVRGVALGPAAVLFTAIGVAAWADGQGTPVEVPALVGSLGLMLFTFTIGVACGPSLFRSLRTAWRLVVSVVAALVVVAVVGVMVGLAMGMDVPLIAGTFAGAVNNTPALGAAVEASGSSVPTIGYSVAYLFGALGPLALIVLALRHRSADTDTPPQVVSRSIRVERTEGFRTLGDVNEWFSEQVTFSRVRHEEDGPVETAMFDDPLRVGDVLVIDGPTNLVEEATTLLGHVSTHHIERESHRLAMRRITVSSPALVGVTLGDLRMSTQFGAAVTRIRRGDVDKVAAPEDILQMGDRLRVICPADRMDSATAFLGDSARGNSELNPLALAGGMAIGALVGLVTVPGVGLSLGVAAGCLIVGLVFGRVGRVGPVALSMPISASQALTDLGLLLFLAQAGTTAGGQIGAAFASGDWVRIVLLGAFFTSALVAVAYLVVRRLFGTGGTKTAGMLSAVQTQPALLAFSNGATGSDARVALGYAMIYPAMMIGKILIAQVLGSIA
ncbi:transporter [Xylanimonas allomyrinae]|uniref:Transporter n=1 Tax=Xylanimonas allomyrinae TaxID=2509459 RepID=A0A4P6EYA0_9MICO|nr:TrkA C-terminal domain-containing protein [Xylanimonas allomyrinae]QAY63038.1 transporter [Xylanimonas allomyrinae]